jgi:hypothetical protein
VRLKRNSALHSWITNGKRGSDSATIQWMDRESIRHL